MAETRKQRRERERREEKTALELANRSRAESKTRFSEVLSLISFAFTLASWGWSVIAPDSSAIFGSVLLFIAVGTMLLAIIRLWALKKLVSASLTVVALLGFLIFDWYVVIKPQRGKPFQALLMHGYYLTGECGNLHGDQQMPIWLRDESKAWQGQVEQLISEKTPVRDMQLWQSALVVGRVTDENVVSYQCMWLANKVGALETIVSNDYDPTLKHRKYVGPIYWFNPVNGKVDISDAFKGGMTDAHVAFGPDDVKPKELKK